MSIVDKIDKAGLVGRGGAEFPTALKWRSVKKARADQKYVVCNASEGELGLFKDIYILENHLDKVMAGMKLAMEYLGHQEAYFNLNAYYYRQIKDDLEIMIKKYRRAGYKFKVYKEDPSYIGGEETALLNAIEGKRVEPRLKPPYPSEVGLFGKPTIINNVETFFDVAEVANGIYEGKRFFCISKEEKPQGVYHLPADWNLNKVLKETGNLPKFNYFLQVGGGCSGLVVNKKQADRQKMVGAGSIDIYRTSIKPRDLLLKWFKFYANESCGKCTPCRMGCYNLHELVKNSKQVPWDKMMKILDPMDDTSFCALGKSVSVPVRSYRKNVLKK